MPKKQKFKLPRGVEKARKKVGHALTRYRIVYELLVALLIVGIIFFGVRGTLCLALRTGDPYRAVISPSMAHADDLWRNYFSKLGYDTSSFPLQAGFERGDLIFVQGVNPLEDIRIGDVIIVDRGPSVTPLVHRVIEIWEENGEIWFKTKGDANSASYEFYYEGGVKVPGDYPIRPQQILGRVIFSIPKLGYLSLWFQGQ